LPFIFSLAEAVFSSVESEFFAIKIELNQCRFFTSADCKNCRKSVHFAQCLFEEFLTEKYH
jgi:hypothetical protein